MSEHSVLSALTHISVFSLLIYNRFSPLPVSSHVDYRMCFASGSCPVSPHPCSLFSLEQQHSKLLLLVFSCVCQRKAVCVVVTVPPENHGSLPALYLRYIGTFVL